MNQERARQATVTSQSGWLNNCEHKAKSYRGNMKSSLALVGLLLVLGIPSRTIAMPTPRAVTLRGYVIDSACTFTKGLKKPVSAACAVACARAGSPLVILASDDVTYRPVSDATPAKGQNSRLMPFAGKRVTVGGNICEKGGSEAIATKTIQRTRNGKEGLK